MPIPVAVGVGIQAGGLLMGALGSSRAAKAARRAARKERALAEIQAQSVRASGQRQAFEEQRQAQLVESRALALAAASGAGASDPTAVKILSGIEAEGAYRAAVRMYESEEEARYLELSGKLRAGALNDQASATRFGGLVDLATGAGSLYARYGGGGPEKVKTSGIDTGDQSVSYMPVRSDY